MKLHILAGHIEYEKFSENMESYPEMHELYECIKKGFREENVEKSEIDMSYDKNGSRVELWYCVECFVVKDGNMPVSVIGKLHDITRIKQAQMSMRRQRIENMYHDHDIDYDLIFMDHFMPGMDGVETTARIRDLSDENKRELPVIALTADAMKGVREELISKGMSDFLTKPIVIGDLYKMLRKWLPEEKIC